MENLSNQKLVETFAKAKELQLADVFIQLIEDEISKRKLLEEEKAYVEEIRGCH